MSANVVGYLEFNLFNERKINGPQRLAWVSLVSYCSALLTVALMNTVKT